MTHFRNIILALVAIFALAALVAAFQRRAEGSTAATPLVTLTVHDGAGRLHRVTGRWTSLVWDGATQTITLDVTTDSLFCGSFE